MADDLIQEHRVIQHEHLGIEDRGVLRPHGLSDSLLDGEDLVSGPEESLLEAGGFVVDVVWADGVSERTGGLAAMKKENGSPADAAGNGNASEHMLTRLGPRGHAFPYPESAVLRIQI